jgi:hypothetical protein
VKRIALPRVEDDEFPHGVSLEIIHPRHVIAAANFGKRFLGLLAATDGIFLPKNRS